MKTYVGINCGCWLAVIIFNILVGMTAVNYLIWIFFEKTIPVFWAIVLGLFTAEFSVPVAIVTWVLKSLHVF